MTNYKEIIRLHSLGLNKTRIAESCGCARSTVITALHKAEENGLSWNAVKNLSSEEVTRKLYPATSMGQRYSIQSSIRLQGKCYIRVTVLVGAISKIKCWKSCADGADANSAI